MGKSDWIILFICCIQLIGIGVVFFQCHEIIGEIRAMRKLLKKDMQNHQDWLFNQLYTIAPGKVLRPDEIEPKEESKKAVVINRNRDPMREFDGGLDDWHG